MHMVFIARSDRHEWDELVGACCHEEISLSHSDIPKSKFLRNAMRSLSCRPRPFCAGR